jgi:hypothetical protein
LDTNKELFETIGKLLNHIPESWVELTTHRLDIYNEKLAKSDFLSHFENLPKHSIRCQLPMITFD